MKSNSNLTNNNQNPNEQLAASLFSACSNYSSIWNKESKYTQAQEDFLKAHPADKKDIQMCFEWLTDNQINDEEYINKVMQHYKLLAPYLKLISIEDISYHRREDHSYSKDVIDKLISQQPSLNDTQKPAIYNIPTEQFTECLPFKMTSDVLNSIIALLTPLNNYADCIALFSNKDLSQPLIKISDEEINSLLTMMALVDRYCGDLKNVGFKRTFVMDNEGLWIQTKELNALLDSHKTVAPRFSMQVHQQLLMECKEDVVLLNAKELASVLEPLIEVAYFYFQDSEKYNEENEYISAPHKAFRKKIDAFLTPYRMQKEMAWTIVNQILPLEIFKNYWKHLELQHMELDLIYLLYSVDVEKRSALAPIANEFFHLYAAQDDNWGKISKFNGNLMKKWALENTATEAMCLTNILITLNKLGLVNQSNCEKIMPYANLIKEDIYPLFTCSRNSAYELKQFMFDTYVENLNKRFNLQQQNSSSLTR